MNPIKLQGLLESLFKEVGENTAEPYETRRRQDNSGNSSYTWNTEEGANYTMDITKVFHTVGALGDRGEYYYTVEFGTRTRGSDRVDYKSTSKTTKTGNLRRVMATVLKSVKDEIAIDNSKPNTQVREIHLEPSKSFDTDRRRARLYLAYVEKNKPEGSTVYHDEDSITIEFPTKERQ